MQCNVVFHILHLLKSFFFKLKIIEMLNTKEALYANIVVALLISVNLRQWKHILGNKIAKEGLSVLC